jgi:hypothetical protein
MFLLTGANQVGVPTTTSQKPCEWLSDSAWEELVNLTQLPGYGELSENIREDPNKWKFLVENADPDMNSLPAPFNNLSTFGRLLIMRYDLQSQLQRVNINLFSDFHLSFAILIVILLRFRQV